MKPENSEFIIRQEQKQDHVRVHQLIEEAFRSMAISDHREQFLVDRLRNSDAFIPELSLVAEVSSDIIGYILLTKIFINNAKVQYPSLTLAPVAVKPQYQGRGIGGGLILKAHEVAKQLGFTSITVLGHPNLYTRFGYVQSDQFSILFPFDVPARNCMIIELEPNTLESITGTVQYPPPFYE